MAHWSAQCVVWCIQNTYNKIGDCEMESEMYSIHRALLCTQAAPTFDAAWSQVVDDDDDDEIPSGTLQHRARWAWLVVCVSLLTVVLVWFVMKLVAEQQFSSPAAPSSAPAKIVDNGPVTVPDVPPMPDVPDVTVADRDSRYVALLRDQGITVVNRQAGAESARDLCAAKARGVSRREMIQALVQANSNLDPAQAPIIVQAALETYCGA